jgi:hypothetical protein
MFRHNASTSNTSTTTSTGSTTSCVYPEWGYRMLPQGLNQSADAIQRLKVVQALCTKQKNAITVNKN